MEYQPHVVSWNVTKRCNLKCAHCYLSAGEAEQGELTTEEALQVVDQVAQAGTELLILSGGEPLMRKDVFQIARHASTLGVGVVLGTNGTLLGEDTVHRIKEAGVQGAGISVDSLNATKHDAFRGVRGAWEKAVRGIRWCVAAEVPVLIQTTVTPWNYDEIPDLIRFASDEGAVGFTLYFLVCTGRGEALTDITPEQYEGALALLIEGQAQNPNIMVRARCAPHIRRLAFHRDSALISSAGCLAGTIYGRIASDGDVTPCPYLPIRVGNVKQTPLGQIWADSPLLQQMRSPRLTGRCGVCEFQRDCGGCRARAYAASGELWGEDPFCSYQPKAEGATDATPISWDGEALARLQKIPGFVRDRVKQGVERFARSRGYAKVDVQVMEQVLRATGRHGPRPAAVQPSGHAKQLTSQKPANAGPEL